MIIADVNYLDIIQLGFHGLAFAMCLLAYNALKNIADKQPPATLDHAQAEVWQKNIQNLLQTLRWLVVVSVVFFVLGVAAQIGAPLLSRNVPQNITFLIVPDPPTNAIPVLLKKGRQLDTATNCVDRRYEFSVVQNDELKVSIQGLVDRIRCLEQAGALIPAGFQSGRLGE